MPLRTTFNLLRWLLPTLGAGLMIAGLVAAVPAARLLLGVVGGLLLALGLVLLWGHVRPNASRVDPHLRLESWPVTADGMHNSNTDLIVWGEWFYLVHAVSPYHFASLRCHLSLLRSADGRDWEPLATLSSPDEDIRDPKLAVIGDRLFLYALVNRSFDPEPYTTVYTSSEDGGRSWLPLQRLAHEGWLFWKPKTRDGRIWYAAAYWHEHGRSALFESLDGIEWRRVCPIYDGGRRNDETDIEFVADGSLRVVARLEGDFREWGYSMFFGDPEGGTLIASAQPPIREFRAEAFSSLTRLDGPALFSHAGRVFAVGRYQPHPAQPFTRQGSIFARKRTSLFEVRPDGLVWLSDLPSAGDTAYAGVAVHEGRLFVSYYTSRIDRDYPWIEGMLNATEIRMARLDLESLVRLASRRDPGVVRELEVGREAS